MIKDLEQELAEKLSNEMAEEIDWGLLCDLLTEVGWVKVAISEPWSNMTSSFAHEIKEWCKENLKGHYKARGRVWVFEKAQDAEWFMLRWG
jgi:hypothetical protein